MGMVNWAIFWKIGALVTNKIKNSEKQSVCSSQFERIE